MVSLDLARRLSAAGLRWTPALGDHFVIDQPDTRDQRFVLSDMTVDVHDYPGGQVLGFNGTTEWALDSVEVTGALWLPAEHQLRDRLGASFLRLERRGDSFAVVTRAGSGERVVAGDDPAECYGEALLALLAA